MTDFTPNEPIVVHATPTAPQIAAGLRQVILALGSIVAALESMGIGDKFHLSADLNNALGYVGGVAAVIAIVWGQIETRRNAQKAAAMANALPNSTAVTK
jgi:uncharacterized membrane protein